MATSTIKNQGNYMSLYGGTEISTPDLNTIVEPGNYFSYNGTTIINGPVSSGAFTLKVEASAGRYGRSYVRQIFRVYDSNKIFERIYNNIVWSNWTHSVTQDERSSDYNALSGRITPLENAALGRFESVQIGHGETKRLTFSGYNHAALIFVASASSSGLYLFGNGYFSTISSSPDFTVVFDTTTYKDITITNNHAQLTSYIGVLYPKGVGMTVT